MSISNSTYDLAIIGAGSAGLSAADSAAKAGLSVVLIEAAHRIGGRAYTDTDSFSFPYDLGCHWMHSASLNPYVAIAEAHGHAYVKEEYPRSVRIDKRWASDAEVTECEAFFERCYAAIDGAVAAGRDVAFADVTPREDRWTPMFDFWVSIDSSADSDQVSTVDSARYNDTNEDWPLVNGYGSLVAAHFGHVPVELNCRAERIDWSGPDVRITTPKGDIRAARVMVTVSTGVLAAGAIDFAPRLPDWKLEAIAGLPLGSHNRVGFEFDRDVFGSDERAGYTAYNDTPDTINMQVRPFGRNHASAVYGGRFSAWLERAGPEAMTDYALENLKAVYGNQIEKHLVRSTTSAWDGDPFVRGAYSCALPGHGGARAKLAEPIDDALFFAGEATSREFYSTCHGAYLSGIASARAVAASLSIATAQELAVSREA
jgi:monoamine oxidase